jgi:hypothetical protein
VPADGGAFERELMEAMLRPLGDESQASSILPYLVRMPVRDFAADFLWDEFVNAG